MKHVNVPEHWSPREALAVAAFLERVAEAIWRAHGPDMALHMAVPEAIARLRPPPRISAASAGRVRLRARRPVRDSDIPF